MALLALKIKIEDTNNPTNPSITKVFRFPINASVREVLNDIVAKTEKGGRDYGLFQPADPKNLHPARWLKDDRTLAYYDLKNEVIKIFRRHWTRGQPLRPHPFVDLKNRRTFRKFSNIRNAIGISESKWSMGP
jgi:hypothetical protein